MDTAAPLRIAVAGMGSRGALFARLAYAAHGVTVAAIADIDAQKLQQLGDEFAVPAAHRYASWQDLATARLALDAVVVATMDQDHVAPTLAFLDQGCHVLLEKPMAVTLAECRVIEAAQRRSGKMVSVCHSMRYNKAFQTVKELVDGGAIGRIISIDLLEQVEHQHQVHSFVRGNWGNSERSAPMILAKSCHDMDWLCYLVGASAERVSSFGSLTWFRPENAPAGATKRCTDGCPHEATCAYSAIRRYVDANREDWPAAVCSPTDHSREAHLAAITTGPYGRCAWRCDNDVVDHQVLALEFPRGITATFTMTGFTAGGGRVLRVHGSQGELAFSGEQAQITIREFATGNVRTLTVGQERGGHGGGDDRLFRAFIDAVRHADPTRIRTSAQESLRSHALAFAAEISRRERRQVEIAELVAEAETGAPALAR